MSLPELAKLMKLHAELESVLKDGRVPQLLDQPALTIATYKKDSIWNTGVPLKPLTRFKDLNERKGFYGWWQKTSIMGRREDASDRSTQPHETNARV
jgi:hypothetical protein